MRRFVRGKSNMRNGFVLGNVSVDVAGKAGDFVEDACSISLDAEICRVMVAILNFHVVLHRIR